MIVMEGGAAAAAMGKLRNQPPQPEPKFFPLPPILTRSAGGAAAANER